MSAARVDGGSGSGSGSGAPSPTVRLLGNLRHAPTMPASSASASSGSARRVNFDAHSSSARRGNEGHHFHHHPFGSSSRKVSIGSPGGSGANINAAGGGGGGGSGGGGSVSGLSQEQQSATMSAVSMNSIFAEARREIRRGLASAARAERKEDDLEHWQLHHGAGSLPPTPAAGGKDIEVGASPYVGAGGGADVFPVELDWHTDLMAMREMLESNYVLSSMLLCIPLGILAHFTHIGGESASFIFNFIAIIPLAWLLGNATEELALRTSQTIGGLLNATFGQWNIEDRTNRAAGSPICCALAA